MEQTLKYKIKEPNENPKEALIEKTGHVITFTLAQIEANTEAMKKIVTEIIAKRDHEAAKMKNIEEHHPYVKNFDDEELHTIHMYQESKKMVKMADDKLMEFKAQNAADEMEVKDILEQIPELDTTNASTELTVDSDAPASINAATDEIKTDDEI